MQLLRNAFQNGTDQVGSSEQRAEIVEAVEDVGAVRLAQIEVELKIVAKSG